MYLQVHVLEVDLSVATQEAIQQRAKLVSKYKAPVGQPGDIQVGAAGMPGGSHVSTTRKPPRARLRAAVAAARMLDATALKRAQAAAAAAASSSSKAESAGNSGEVGRQKQAQSISQQLGWLC